MANNNFEEVSCLKKNFRISVFLAILTLLTLVFILVACDKTTEAPPETPPPEETTVIEIPAPSLEELEIVPQGEIAYDPEKDIFNLTEKEKNAFISYQKDFDYNNTFKDFEPLEIARVWIYSGIVDAWESEYEMYGDKSLETGIDNEDGSTKPFSKKIAYNLYFRDKEMASTISKKEMAELNFSTLDEAEWSLESDTAGRLVFIDGIGEPLALKFEKNDAGVWELPYYPFTR